MGIWADHMLPRCTDVALGSNDVARHRRRTTVGLHGAVVEIGFGSGMNVPWYPDTVTHVSAVEPSRTSRQRAADRIGQAEAEVIFVGLDGQQIPLPTASMDCALSTFTLCTIPDANSALAELRRVLKPGGVLHFLEHGLSETAGVASWQHRLNPIEVRVAGGCNLNRKMDKLVMDAGFELIEIENSQLGGPALSRPWGYLYRGIARSPGPAR